MVLKPHVAGCKISWSLFGVSSILGRTITAMYRGTTILTSPRFPCGCFPQHGETYIEACDLIGGYVVFRVPYIGIWVVPQIGIPFLYPPKSGALMCNL